ncbi:MAG: replication factor C small subunit [Candidatus ainarchaeum sp.]|nr:replication factor C small subunit [Candidatus ainarchaeum sp.]
MEQDNLPWVEKYRPKKIADVIGHDNLTKRLQSYIDQKNVPNLLLSGPAGTGKTSSSIALAKELFKENFDQNFLELNASDDRGIDIVRHTIKDFARTLAFDSNFKIIFLDECDALTNDAQQALRRTMEKYTKTCRFILSCNYSSKIIDPLQSRCVVYRFKPLNGEEIKNQIKKIALIEKIDITDDALDAINYVAQGDLRKAINILQASSSIDEKIDSEIIYSVSSRARPEQIQDMILLALDGNFLEARKKLDQLMYEYGMSGEDIIKQLYRETMNLSEEHISNQTKIELVDTIGEYDFRLVEGANERIQLEALIAQYLKYKK